MTCLHPIFMYRHGFTKNGKQRFTASPSKADIYQVATPFPCGRCLACYHNRRMEWQRRMVIESWLHKHSSFVTLTYNPENLHHTANDLGKHNVQRFLKRLRNSPRDFGVPPFHDFKYFIAVELGKKFKRPHYHCIFFGVDCLDPSWQPFIALYKGNHPIYSSRVLEKVWRDGFVSVDVANPKSIMYTTKYILKACIDREGWYIFSQGIGRDYFVKNKALTSSCKKAIENGFLVYDKYKSPIPRFLDRYLDKYAPDLLASLKDLRRKYVASKPVDLRSADERELAIKCRLQSEQLKRKLDNES